MSAFVIGVPAPEGLDPRIYRVRVVVDRVDGAALTAADLERIRAVYTTEAIEPTVKRRTKSTKPAAARMGKVPAARARARG
jgi:hypothetical protein